MGWGTYLRMRDGPPYVSKKKRDGVAGDEPFALIMGAGGFKLAYSKQFAGNCDAW